MVALLCGAVICQRGEEDDCRVVNDKDGAKYGSCSRNMVRVSDSSEVLQTAKRIAGALSSSVSRSVDLSILRLRRPSGLLHNGSEPAVDNIHVLFV